MIEAIAFAAEKKEAIKKMLESDSQASVLADCHQATLVASTAYYISSIDPQQHEMARKFIAEARSLARRGMIELARRKLLAAGRVLEP